MNYYEMPLLEKQQLLADAGVAGYASTQMCFNPTTISRWLEAERSRGMDLPIHLGLPGWSTKPS